MRRNDYWRKREEEQLKHYLTEESGIQRAIAEKYNYMLYQIQAQINDFYARYARREQITLAEAMQRVSKMDVQAFGAKAKKYVEEKDFSAKANQELRLYNATMRINRLELLKANIGLEMVDGFNDLEHLMDDSLTKRTVDELNRQEDILRREAGILNTTVFDNAKTVRQIVNASFNNATWSERIWGNQTQLRNQLASLLTQGLIQGRNPRVLAPELKNMFGVSRRNAERLMATELARVQTDAQMESFRRNDIDEYVFISVDTACSHCMALNEKHFPVKDMMPGENAPPIHPNCRCSTAAYVDREAIEREVFGGQDVQERERLQKEYSNAVQTQLLNAPGFVDKFKGITGNDAVDNSIYECATKMLRHRNGTNYEDLYLIDANTGEVIHSLTTCDLEHGVDYDQRTLSAIKEAKKNNRQIIAVHNHPSGLPPSLDDGVSAFKNGYEQGVAVGHNLEVYRYTKTNNAYSREECKSIHNSLARSVMFDIDFDEDQWYNILKEFGMEVERK